ncbi:helix-turn-helix domain-containing protein [Rhodococcus rhodochrous]|uniref:Helix-turn-helix domain-containing protein n=1 Tax=Rhodococcus rhodochrous TaxID=1829 RepID=A0AAW4XDY0_RHORH|nr:helix-turn-helix domain-containing protein [Rhodococcus rhodochrous]MCD2111045.1 helix-turn-helix domain-containing protein [Rhodococcus rhodochrous]
MTETTVEAADPTSITSRAEFGRALTALRTRAGLSIRDVVDASGALHGTVAGWFSGQHLPTRASEPAFRAVLAACGVADEIEADTWIAAARRARQARTKRRDTGPIPYRGLSSFEAEDAEWFFGRDDITEDVLRRIRAAVAGQGPRVILVVGPSGAGKSSLLRAGVAAAVGSDETDLRDWKPVVLTPASAGPDKLAGILDVDHPTVLVVDQFEELWTSGEEEDRHDFLEHLAQPSDDIVVVLGLRADFYGLAAREPHLVPILESGPVVVGPMSAAELESVIVQPAAKAGVTVPPELVKVLLTDLSPRASRTKDEPGTLPLLSHALLRLWQRAERRTLTVADYTAVGGISGAVQQTAEELYSELTPEQQRLTRRVFLRLVNVDDDTQTRRRTPRSELAFGDVDAVDEIVDRFADARLLTVDEDSVQLSHEVLLTAWDRLRGWIDADRAGLAVHRELTRAAQVWEDSDRDDTTLLGGGRLVLHDDWSRVDDNADALNDTEREFLARSLAHRDAEVEAERRRTRMLRRLVGALTVTAVIALVLVVVATTAGISARTERADAQRARDDAMSRQIATVSSQLSATEPALAAQFALAGYRVADTVEARSALLDTTGVRTPVRLTGPAGPLQARSTPDGSTVVSAASDGTVRLWAVGETGPSITPTAEFGAGDGAGELYALAVSPDGDSVAVGGQGGIWLWDIRNRTSPQQRAVLANSDHTAYSLEFSPDGRQLVAGTGSGTVLRWNTNADEVRELSSLDHPAEGAVYPAFSPDSRWLVVAGRQMSLRVWDAQTQDAGTRPVFETPPDGGTEHLLSVAFSPDGRTVAAGTTGRHVLRWDMADPAVPVPLAALEGFTSYVNTVAFAPDGRRLVAGSSDNTVRIWADGTTPDAAESTTTLPGSNPVTSVVFTDEGRAVLTAALDGSVGWWPVLGPVLPADEAVYVTPVDADGTLVLFGQGRSNALPLWNIADPGAAAEQPSLSPPVEDRFSGAAALSKTGSLAAAGTSGGSVHLWDLTDPAAPQFAGTAEGVVAGVVGVVEFAPDRPVVAVTATEDAKVAIVDASDPVAPRVVGTFEADDYPYMLSWHPTADIVAAASAGGLVELWDLSDPADPTRISELSGFESQAQTVAFGGDGTVLAAASADRSVRLWDVADPAAPRELARITGPADAVYSLHFSPDGNRLAAGVGDGSAWIWDVTRPDSPTTHAVLAAYGSRVYDATFAHNGAVLVGGGPDRSVRLWQLDPETVEATLCSTVGTPVTEDEWERHLPGVPFRPPCGDTA